MPAHKVLSYQVVAMAHGRVFFAAHDAGGLDSNQLEELFDALEKPWTLHYHRITNFGHEFSRMSWDDLMFIAS